MERALWAELEGGGDWGVNAWEGLWNPLSLAWLHFHGRLRGSVQRTVSCFFFSLKMIVLSLTCTKPGTAISFPEL